MEEVSPISTAELERRWSAVRKEMPARGIDALPIHNRNDWLGGSVSHLIGLDGPESQEQGSPATVTTGGS